MEKNIKDPVKAENPTGFSVIVREFKKDKLALFSFFAVTIFIIAVFVASMFINLQQLQTVDIFRKYEVPSFNNFWNFFGRDSGGRSVMGYVIVGARNSITIGVIITIVTTFIGLFVGLCMGYYGGKVDALGMRIVDFISIMPSVMIIIVFVSIVPKYGIFQFILIFSMFYWTRTTRLARSKTLSETRRDYVNASKTMGTSDLKIMFSEILPNISSIIIVNGTLALASNIGIEVALSFLGFGLPAATPSLGTLISYASKPEIIQYKAYVWLPAALVLLFMMLGINYIGQALRRAADAKQRLG
ncbi:ABC transporter permease [Fusobacterium pseudoperiodonticum]|jgi:oligopeptide transport system permease oppC|uniref:ABC transporter permease n=1 Tax=Fusobacterium pseudoperiodonticum TaxID=2663009 RepID=UPI0028EFE4CE|nr:ABC transporter permease [Fusobacterium pseudoperiodonticum]